MGRVRLGRKPCAGWGRGRRPWGGGAARGKCEFPRGEWGKGQVRGGAWGGKSVPDGAGGPGAGERPGVFTQCSWVFLAFATEPYYNKKRNWVTAPAGGEAREVF